MVNLGFHLPLTSKEIDAPGCEPYVGGFVFFKFKHFNILGLLLYSNPELLAYFKGR